MNGRCVHPHVRVSVRVSGVRPRRYSTLRDVPGCSRKRIGIHDDGFDDTFANGAGATSNSGDERTAAGLMVVVVVFLLCSGVASCHRALSVVRHVTVRRHFDFFMPPAAMRVEYT